MTNLQAKVAARNAVHSEIRRFAPSFLLALAPFVGKADGSFTQAFKDAMPNAGQYWNSSRYSLSRVFKADAQGERSNYYQDATVYLGEIEGNVLQKLHDFDPNNFPVNYNADDILAARAEVRAAQEALNRAERKLVHFGEHDNN